MTVLRRSVMETVSDTTSHWNDLAGVRRTAPSPSTDFRERRATACEDREGAIPALFSSTKRYQYSRSGGGFSPNEPRQDGQRFLDPRAVPRRELAVHEVKAAVAHGRDLGMRPDICQVRPPEAIGLIRQQDDLGRRPRHLVERHLRIAP